MTHSLFGQHRWATASGMVGEHRWVRFTGEGDRPIVDALPGHAHHVGDVGGRSTPVEFQQGQSSSISAGIASRLELLTELTALPMLQIQPAHLGLPLMKETR
jgi:hypothetical protein